MNNHEEPMLTRSAVFSNDRVSEGEVNGRWVVEVKAAEGLYPAGTLVCDAAGGQPDDFTFTAPNGKRYWDIPQGVRWTPREPSVAAHSHGGAASVRAQISETDDWGADHEG